MSEISVNVNNIEFKSPVLLASGVLDETSQSMKLMEKAGAGGIVTKSIGMNSRPGHNNPVFCILEHGLINAMGLPNPGADEYRNELLETGLKVPVIASIFGSSTEEFLKIIDVLDIPGVKAFELNLSCPHAKGYGADIGQEPEMVKQFTQEIKAGVSKPLWVKLTPNVTNISAIGKAAQDGGADAVVAINTLKAMSIDPYAKRPVLTTRFGGYSGPAIKPVGIRMVYELYAALEIPVIGVGGISSGLDVIEYMLAGASAVQAGSVIYYRGKEAFSLINNEIKSYICETGISSLNGLTGMAHGK